MAPRQLQFEQKPEPGDLIEIFRGGYQHWAIYVGEGYVIHLAPPSEFADAGAYSMMSVLCDKAMVKKEPLWDVVGTDKYVINNLLDDKYEPLPIRDILREARRRLHQEQPYCVIRENCEHFVTEIRYGKPESRQVRQAVDIAVGVGVTAALVFGAVVLVKAVFGSEDKERKNKQ